MAAQASLSFLNILQQLIVNFTLCGGMILATLRVLQTNGNLGDFVAVNTWAETKRDSRRAFCDGCENAWNWDESVETCWNYRTWSELLWFCGELLQKGTDLRGTLSMSSLPWTFWARSTTWFGAQCDGKRAVETIRRPSGCQCHCGHEEFRTTTGWNFRGSGRTLSSFKEGSCSFEQQSSPETDVQFLCQMDYSSSMVRKSTWEPGPSGRSGVGSGRVRRAHGGLWKSLLSL